MCSFSPFRSAIFCSESTRAVRNSSVRSVSFRFLLAARNCSSVANLFSACPVLCSAVSNRITQPQSSTRPNKYHMQLINSTFISQSAEDFLSPYREEKIATFPENPSDIATTETRLQSDFIYSILHLRLWKTGIKSDLSDPHSISLISLYHQSSKLLIDFHSGSGSLDHSFGAHSESMTTLLGRTRARDECLRLGEKKNIGQKR